MKVYLVSIVHWFIDEDSNGEEIGWAKRICENVKVFRDKKSAEEFAERMNRHFARDQLDELYDYFRNEVQEFEVV